MVGALVSIGYGLVSHVYVYTNLKLLSSKFKIREERMERMSLVTKIALQRKGIPPKLLSSRIEQRIWKATILYYYCCFIVTVPFQRVSSYILTSATTEVSLGTYMTE